jgi:hypothetical protein
LSDPVYTSLAWPFDISTLPDLPADSKVVNAAGSSGVWEDQPFSDGVYSYVKIKNEIHSKFSSEAAYGWTFVGMNLEDGLPNEKRYGASGVNVNSGGGAILALDFVQTEDWNIVAKP